MSTPPRVVVLDYGSGNVRSAVRALERVGAAVDLTADPSAALECDGLFVPGVGNFHACMAGLAPRTAPASSADGSAVVGRCSASASACRSSSTARPSRRDRPGAAWASGPAPSSASPPRSSRTWAGPRSRSASGPACSRGVEHERFYFVHSYAVQRGTRATGAFAAVAPVVSWAEHGATFVAAVENGPLSATQFHPEKSGEAGLQLLENWVRSL